LLVTSVKRHVDLLVSQRRESGLDETKQNPLNVLEYYRKRVLTNLDYINQL